MLPLLQGAAYEVRDQRLALPMVCVSTGCDTAVFTASRGKKASICYMEAFTVAAGGQAADALLCNNNWSGAVPAVTRMTTVGRSSSLTGDKQWMPFLLQHQVPCSSGPQGPPTKAPQEGHLPQLLRRATYSSTPGGPPAPTSLEGHLSQHPKRVTCPSTIGGPPTGLAPTGTHYTTCFRAFFAWCNRWVMRRLGYRVDILPGSNQAEDSVV